MRLLIAEDDREAVAFLGQGLRDIGHEVIVAETGEAAMQVAASQAFDVIILDRLLPGIDGIGLLRHLRASGVATPVLILTALGSIADRVEGLEAGADDYLVKPFAFAELTARLNALARRLSVAERPTLFEVGPVSLDLLSREVHRDGREILLQPREFSLLEQLMRHAGKIVTRTMFLELVWGFHFDPQTNIVESHMSRLRSKLNEGFSSDPIETLRGVGYRMRADA